MKLQGAMQYFIFVKHKNTIPKGQSSDCVDYNHALKTKLDQEKIKEQITVNKD